MAGTETAVRRDRRGVHRWVGGALAGLAAGIAFGLYLQFAIGLFPPVDGPGGVERLATDWAVHLFHSVVFALVYAGVASWPPAAGYADRPATGAVLGAGYGAAVWLVAVGVALAFWTAANAVWVLPIPTPSLASLAGHVLYGVVLGAAFAVVRRA
ncbi:MULTISPECIES: hypothetical protein [Halorussus]|uniref:hypothetical protein n=1 Tax=Halorussus TaxID=1070314 RepID=UPI000E216AC4|nr:MULTISPECIES: hypothetical protein [Halorussus]NHN60577.1 hypothetical protein [Halorussus sp. JP-T4]